MNKSEVIEIIKRMMGDWTCVWTCDNQGYNAAYASVPVEQYLDDINCLGYENMENLTKEDWKLAGFIPISEGDIDVEEWGQEFSENIREGIRQGIKDGDYSMATFVNDEAGTIKILVY